MIMMKFVLLKHLVHIHVQRSYFSTSTCSSTFYSQYNQPEIKILLSSCSLPYCFSNCSLAFPAAASYSLCMSKILSAIECEQRTKINSHQHFLCYIYWNCTFQRHTLHTLWYLTVCCTMICQSAKSVERQMTAMTEA